MLFVLGGLAIIAVLAVVVVAAALLLASPAQGPAATVSFDVPTARDGYPTAITMARQSDPAAVLVSAAGAWTPTINPAVLNAGRTGWTYYIYLPATKQMAAIVVDRRGSARMASSQKWQTAPEVLDDNTWSIDSGGGMPAFLQKCQGDLSASPDRQVQAWLSTARAGGRLTWSYRVMAPDQTVVCAVAVDAGTGQVK